MVRNPINLVHELIMLGLIKDPLLSTELSINKEVKR